MTDRADYRRPAAFRLDDPKVIVADTPTAQRSPHATIQVMPELDPTLLPAVIAIPETPARRGFRWSTLLWTALGGLAVLGLGVSVSRLIEDLFARDTILGSAGLALAVLALVAAIAIVAREAIALSRLATIEKLHLRAASILVNDDRDESRAIVQDLLALLRDNPRLARGRTILQGHADDIIDGADRVRLAERELMTPLDAEARRLVSNAAQRVSVVTAISPRAAVDMIFVFVSAIRLMRQLALLYGGRPGALGMIRLVRHVISHLAITGGMAASDSLIQQMLGHGLAAKLSERLGEGILNGLLTARLGLAAIDVTRPLPFTALPRPALTDLAKDLLRSAGPEKVEKLAPRRE